MSDPRLQAIKQWWSEQTGDSAESEEYHDSFAELLAAIDATTAPNPKTVRVRVAVAVDPTGRWSCMPILAGSGADAFYWAEENLNSGAARHILTAELPIPEPQEVQAVVESPGASE